jgi:hypothetical protein
VAHESIERWPELDSAHASNERLNHGEADIVSGVVVRPAWITQPNDQPHGSLRDPADLIPPRACR